nr:actin-binding, cofilin/tropomyosin type [Tanacetum cinerariifolium]
MFLNVEQLEMQLDKEDFQENGSMVAFNVLETQCQMFIMNQDYLNDEYVAMTRSYFIQYTGQAIPEFRDTLIQHLESVKKSIDERSQLKREYDSWVNERQMQATEKKVDTSKALDASSADTESRQQSQFLKEKSNEAKVKHDIDVIETINIELEHKVAKLLKENETLKKSYKELFDSIKTTRAKATEHTTSLIATNDTFKAQLQEKGFAIAALKKELRKSTGNSVNTKFARSSILGKPMSQPLRNQSVVRQPTKNMPRFTSNDMVHNHYLEEAKKRTQEQGRNSEPSLIPSARLQSITNFSKPMPRRNT